jgi:hypothetical protein
VKFRPPRSPAQAPRAHTVLPRRRHGHAGGSRTSPTIVRQHACGAAPFCVPLAVRALIFSSSTYFARSFAPASAHEAPSLARAPQLAPEPGTHIESSPVPRSRSPAASVSDMNRGAIFQTTLPPFSKCLANPRSCGDRFGIRNLSEDAKVHAPSSQTVATRLKAHGAVKRSGVHDAAAPNRSRITDPSNDC